MVSREIPCAIALVYGLSVGRVGGKTTRVPEFADAIVFWLKLGFINFGGPTGQIALMHTELVEKRKWISEARFLHALNFCMLLPGPEATQLAIYIGWLLHRMWGGLAAGVLFVLPSACILWGLSCVYAKFGKVAWVAAIFYGLKPAVLAIVAAALIRIGQRTLKNAVACAMAGLAFVAIYFVRAPFPIIVLGAGLAGLIGGRFWPEKFLISGDHELTSGVETEAGEVPESGRPSLIRALKICVVGLVVWWVPVLLLGGCLGWNHALLREGIFFSKAAMVTFGGAYAVLPYVAQRAVEQYHWLTAGQMLDGLGLAETTPGPLIMVLQFVGFLGGWNQPGNLSPLLSASLGAFITTWTTFVPCFVWIFLGAPHVERLRGKITWTAALSAVTAAVVGVILNLAVWFGLHVIWPDRKLVDWFGVVVSGVAFAGMTKCNWDIVPVVLGAGVCGLFYRWLV